MRRLGWLIPVVYILFLLMPIYWLVNMSFKSTNEILGSFTLYPHQFTLDSYVEILTNPVWYMGYVNSISYVLLNTVISVTVALPAAYAFSRYRFLGDKHLFFWLLTNRMAPAAVFAAAKPYVVIGVGLGFLLWFSGFMVVGGEWFLMWQSKTWNGQEPAFRFYMTLMAVGIFVSLKDGELDA